MTPTSDRSETGNGLKWFQTWTPKVQALSIYPGHVKALKIKMPPEYQAEQKLEVSCGPEPLTYFPVASNKERLLVLVSASYFSNLKSFSCFLQPIEIEIGQGKNKIATKKPKKLIARFKVEKFNFKVEHLKVSKKRVFLKDADQKRVEDEQKKLNKIYESSTAEAYFVNPFRRPLESFITSSYGKRRIFNGGHRTQHLGIDFRAAQGTPVPSANSGIVVFAGELFYTGNTVIIDHGLFLFTVYGHLKQPLVSLGQKITQGEILGRSGNTGRSTGPHLHWGVRYRGEWLSGNSLISETSVLLGPSAKMNKTF